MLEDNLNRSLNMLSACLYVSLSLSVCERHSHGHWISCWIFGDSPPLLFTWQLSEKNIRISEVLNQNQMLSTKQNHMNQSPELLYTHQKQPQQQTRTVPKSDLPKSLKSINITRTDHQIRFKPISTITDQNTRGTRKNQPEESPALSSISSISSISSLSSCLSSTSTAWSPGGTVSVMWPDQIKPHSITDTVHASDPQNLAVKSLELPKVLRRSKGTQEQRWAWLQDRRGR